jgi:peptide/nickel transport system permease protein
MSAAAAPALAPPPATDARRGRRGPTLLRDPIAVAAVLFILGLVAVAVLAPWIAPYSPSAGSILSGNEGISSAHWLGTDSFGRDLLSRLIFGARLSLLGPALIIAISTIVGATFAIAAAWFGGWPDQVVSRVADILFAFPGLIFAMIAVSMFGAGLIAPVIALSIAYTPYLMRVVRAAAIRQRALPYVSACYVEGLPTWKICFRHLLPNVAPILLVQATLSFGYALVDLAAISYLGLGVQPPAAEWGLMVSEGQSSILAGHPQESLTAGMMIILTVVAFNLLGDRLASLQGTELA